MLFFFFFFIMIVFSFSHGHTHFNDNLTVSRIADYKVPMVKEPILSCEKTNLHILLRNILLEDTNIKHANFRGN